jgi:hypothetical protein
VTTDDLVGILLASANFDDYKRRVAESTRREKREFEETVKWAAQQDDLNQD